MLTLIRSSIARELIATLAVGLGLTVGASFAIADYTIGAIEASYENIIFGRIIPDIQHMGDSGFDAEEQSIAREEASAGDALLAEAAHLQVAPEDLFKLIQERQHSMQPEENK